MNRTYKICIDPGHGGFDPGAVGPSGLKEKDVTLSIGLKLREKLQLQGINVVMTRDRDTALGNNENDDLINRATVANNAKADYFVSIHCNSAGPTAYGTETFAYKAGGQGEKLAQAIQEQLIHTIGLRNRGVKFANYAVLRNTNMPAVLVETAFISNPAEEKLLADDAWRDRFAEAIAIGICNHLGIQYKKEVVWVDWKTILKKVAANPEEWEKAINTAVNAANADGDLGDLEIFQYLPVLIEKIYNYKN